MKKRKTIVPNYAAVPNWYKGVRCKKCSKKPMWVYKRKGKMVGYCKKHFKGAK